MERVTFVHYTVQEHPQHAQLHTYMFTHTHIDTTHTLMHVYVVTPTLTIKWTHRHTHVLVMMYPHSTAHGDTQRGRILHVHPILT